MMVFAAVTAGFAAPTCPVRYTLRRPCDAALLPTIVQLTRGHALPIAVHAAAPVAARRVARDEAVDQVGRAPLVAFHARAFHSGIVADDDAALERQVGRIAGEPRAPYRSASLRTICESEIV